MIERFLDQNRLVQVWPKKHADKQLVCEYLVTKFDTDRTYLEREVNDILKQWHTFSDWPLLRRELIERRLMTRDRDGTKYQRSPDASDQE
jgi:hypothetical protein